MIGAHAFQQYLAIASNNSQQVVELVCDSASKLANGFHLLRLKGLLLESPLLGNVGCGSYVTDEIALFVVFCDRLPLDPDFGAVRAPEPIFRPVWSVFTDRFFPLLEYPVTIIRVEGTEPAQARRLIGGQSGHLTPFFIDEYAAPFDVGSQDSYR